MRVSKTNSISFQQFKADEKGKKFLTSLYNITEPKAHRALTNELRIFKQTMCEFAQKMGVKQIDIFFTDTGIKGHSPALELRQGDKVLKDSVNAPSTLYLFELRYSEDNKKWTTPVVKKWFKRAKEEITGWLTLSYIDRFNDTDKSIDTLIKEAQRPSTKKEIIDSIFD